MTAYHSQRQTRFRSTTSLHITDYGSTNKAALHTTIKKNSITHQVNLLFFKLSNRFAHAKSAGYPCKQFYTTGSVNLGIGSCEPAE